MKPLLLIDRDGTIIKEPSDEQIDSFEKLEFFPGVVTWLKKIIDLEIYELVMVTNQDGLGSESFPLDSFNGPQGLLIKTLEGEGIKFRDILIDTSFQHENKPTRKPNTGLLENYMNGDWDIVNSWVIGDRHTDVILAKNLGCKSILISNNPDPEASYTIKTWEEIYNILKPSRISEIHRETSETSVKVRINLDGTGQFKIDTGLHFLNHMLEQFSKHSKFDLEIAAKGDVHIDEHHTMEDVAITLGEALKAAIGDKKGIERYGFYLPMDESSTMVALDFSARPYLKWKVKFERDLLGDTPTEMFGHFFHSLAYTAGLTMHIKTKGKNDHHKAESVFKAVAKAFSMAAGKNSSGLLPSTKGML